MFGLLKKIDRLLLEVSDLKAKLKESREAGQTHYDECIALRAENEKLRLDCRIARMYANDDPAVDELIQAHKEKESQSERNKKHEPHNEPMWGNSTPFMHDAMAANQTQGLAQIQAAWAQNQALAQQQAIQAQKLEEKRALQNQEIAEQRALWAKNQTLARQQAFGLQARPGSLLGYYIK